MKIPFQATRIVVSAAAITTSISLGYHAAAQDLANNLVSYWPMEVVQGTKTPDLVSGYDMQLSNLTATDLTNGIRGLCFNFVNARQTLLSRVHGTNDDLPINKHAAFTISFWAKVNGTGQNDLRMFSEGSTTNTNPLFNLGTHSGGANGQLDVFIRQTGAGLPNLGTVNHIRTTAEPLDDTWHHIVFVQQTDGARTVYIDGTLDSIALDPKPEGIYFVNNTTIGGILRTSPGTWVSGLIDEVALWKRALTEAEVTKLKNEGLTSVFPPVANDLVSHWPMEVVQGGKTPDLVSGYDMQLNNLTAADLTNGIRGLAFNFVNARQTLLSRVHGTNDNLPINKHAAFTISFWAKVNGTGQNDLRMFSEGSTTNTNPLFNLGTHSGGANGQLDVFIRQTGAGLPNLGTVNHIRTTAEPLDDTWHHIVFVQQTDGARTVYIDGTLDSIALDPKPEGIYFVNNTTIGGILRTSPGTWVTGVIDEVALWKRALTEGEVNNVKTNGVPKVFAKQLPLEIKNFSADFTAAAQGDKVTLRWDASADAALSINSGIGDISAQTQFGAGSIEVTVSGTTTFICTATRGAETVTSQITVRSVPNVTANWRLVENFDGYGAGGISGNGKWANPEGAFAVVDLGANKVLSYLEGNALSALPLNSLSLREGQKATLFFRAYVNTNDLDIGLGINFGLTEKGIRFNGDFNANVGPFVRLERVAGGGTTVDLGAHNGVGAAYDYAIDALQPGSAFRVWVDIENKPFDVQGGVQMGGDVYSVFIQKEGAPGRTNLFLNYIADRDAANVDPFFGAPTLNLTHLFFSANGAGQGTNIVFFDDFYLSSNGFNTTIPVPASSFVPGTAPPEPPLLTGFSYAGTAFTFTWTAKTGQTYTVQKRASLDTGTWTTVVTGVTAATYTDNSAGGSTSFYRISSP